MKKPGVKVFVMYNKRLLLILRDGKLNIPFPNTWNLPGGGIDKGESGEEAIRRELKEEIKIVPKNLVYLGKQIYPDGSEVLRYLAKLSDSEYKNVNLGSEGQRLDFFSLDEINSLDVAGYSKEYFLKYTDQLKKVIEKGTEIKPELLGLNS